MVQLIEKMNLLNRKDQKAFYDQWSPVMFKVCLSYTKHTQDAEDALQNGFIKVFSHLHQYKSEGSFEGWLRIIFVRVSIELIRRRKRFEMVEDVAADKEANGLHRLYYKDLQKEIHALPPCYRKVIRLYDEGYKHKDIAGIFGVTESTSKSQYCRGKKLLIKKIA